MARSSLTIADTKNKVTSNKNVNTVLIEPEINTLTIVQQVNSLTATEQKNKVLISPNAMVSYGTLPGPQGIQGVPGKDGVQGIQGIQGVSGAPGATPDLSAYTLLSTTASISANLQTQINNISGGAASGIQGRRVLNNIDVLYTITHQTIDASREFPVVSLECPDGNSDIFITGVYNRTNTSFQVVLSGLPNSSYAILWHITAVVSTTSGDISTTYEYNLSGDMILATNSSGTREFIYDLSGNLEQINGTGIYKSIRYTYSSEGNLISSEIL